MHPVHLIGGCGGSGTTALACALDAQPGLVSGPESGAFHLRELWTERPMRPALERALQGEHAGVDLHIEDFTYSLVPNSFLMHREYYGLTHPTAIAELVEAAETPSAFSMHVRSRFLERHGLEHDLAWVDQTPKNCLAAREYLLAVPGAKFIHLVRDGRGVCAGLARRYASEWIRADRGVHLAAAAARWLYDVHHARRAQGLDGYMEVRYEELVLRPLETLNRIRAHLGMHTLTDEDLRHQVPKVASRVGIAMQGGAKPSWTLRPGRQLSAGALGRWKTELSADELDLLMNFKFQPPDLEEPLDFAATLEALETIEPVAAEPAAD